MFVCSRCGKATKNANRLCKKCTYGKNALMGKSFEHFEYDPHETRFNRLCIQYDNAKTELERCGKQYARLSERCAQIKMELNKLDEARNEHANSINRH